jgi:hypothetical protein
LAETNPVSAEARGKAREFIRRANVEDDLRFALLSGFWRSIQQRKDRQSGRRVRPDILEDIVRRWEAGPRQFRLRFEVERKGKNLSVIEIAASGNGTLRGVPAWAADAIELNLLINTAALSVMRDSVDLVYRAAVSVSAHALGRYFQRQPDCGDADLLRDLVAFSRIVVPPDAPERDVRYATEGGVWVGRIALCDLESHGQTERRAIAFIRTWLPA